MAVRPVKPKPQILQISWKAWSFIRQLFEKKIKE